MAEGSKVEREMGVFILTEGAFPEEADRVLGATPPEISRSVMDLDRSELVGVVNPPKAFMRDENGVRRHISIDEVRACLSPDSIGPLVRAMTKARQMSEGDTFRYSLDYRPIGSESFRMSFEVHPLLLDSRGKAYMIYSDIHLDPL